MAAGLWRIVDTPVLAHWLAGRLLYGAFVAKVLPLRGPRVPPAALPRLGGVLSTLDVTRWATSSRASSTTVDVPGLRGPDRP